MIIFRICQNSELQIDGRVFPNKIKYDRRVDEIATTHRTRFLPFRPEASEVKHRPHKSCVNLIRNKSHLFSTVH